MMHVPFLPVFQIIDLSLSQRFVICFDLQKFLFLRQCINSALLEYSFNLLIKSFVDSSELVTDELRPYEVSLDAFRSPAGRSLRQESTIIADFISNLDKFGVVGG